MPRFFCCETSRFLILLLTFFTGLLCWSSTASAQPEGSTDYEGIVDEVYASVMREIEPMITEEVDEKVAAQMQTLLEGILSNSGLLEVIEEAIGRELDQREEELVNQVLNLVKQEIEMAVEPDPKTIWDGYRGLQTDNEEHPFVDLGCASLDHDAVFAQVCNSLGALGYSRWLPVEHPQVEGGLCSRLLTDFPVLPEDQLKAYNDSNPGKRLERYLFGVGYWVDLVTTTDIQGQRHHKLSVYPLLVQGGALEVMYPSDFSFNKAYFSSLVISRLQSDLAVFESPPSASE